MKRCNRLAVDGTTWDDPGKAFDVSNFLGQGTHDVQQESTTSCDRRQVYGKRGISPFLRSELRGSCNQSAGGLPLWPMAHGRPIG